MVREITMFELHFDGARFGPSFGRESEEEEVQGAETGSDHESAESSGGSKLRPLVAVIGVVLLVTALRKIKNRGSGEDYDIPLEEEKTESVTRGQ